MVKGNKKELTRYEEFEIMKLILDKFLWIGTFIFGFAIYRLVTFPNESQLNYSLLTMGVIIFILFLWILHKEFKHLH